MCGNFWIKCTNLLMVYIVNVLFSLDPVHSVSSAHAGILYFAIIFILIIILLQSTTIANM